MFSGHKRRLFSNWVEFSTLIKTKSLPVKLFTRSLWNLNPPPSFTRAESLMSKLTEKGVDSCSHLSIATWYVTICQFTFTFISCRHDSLWQVQRPYLLFFAKGSVFVWLGSHSLFHMMTPHEKTKYTWDWGWYHLERWLYTTIDTNSFAMTV